MQIIFIICIIIFFFLVTSENFSSNYSSIPNYSSTNYSSIPNYSSTNYSNDVLNYSNVVNFSSYPNYPNDGPILPQVTYNCPSDTELKENICYIKNYPTSDDNKYYLDNSTIDLQCPNRYTLKNDVCVSNYNYNTEKPFCPDGFKRNDNKCLQLNGLPKCEDGFIPYDNKCTEDYFNANVIYTCPDGSINEYGGICNGRKYNDAK